MAGEWGVGAGREHTRVPLRFCKTRGPASQVNQSDWSSPRKATQRTQEAGGAPGHGPEVRSLSHPSWDPILGYINEQYERYLQEEILITRKRHIPDTRVHCCVYFVPPTGHW